MSIHEEKLAVRAEFKAKRDALSMGERIAAGQAISSALFSPRCLNLFDRYRNFATYLSLPNEMPTEEVNMALFARGCYVCVPKFFEDHYTWAPLRPGEPIIRGPKGIFEPASTTPVTRGFIEVAFIPGIAFDTRGGRIGYGGGIYDRLLTRLRGGVVKVALAFDCQVTSDCLPQEEHDLKMDYIVTESHWIDCRIARTERKGH